MANERVLVTIKDGLAVVRPVNIKGAACLTVTRDLERALGKTVSSEPTDEMRQMPATSEVKVGA